MDLSKYNKIIVFILAAIVEVGALWTDAPPWVGTVVLVAGGLAIFFIKNTPMETNNELKSTGR